jgi:anti-sigma factor RsiW
MNEPKRQDDDERDGRELSLCEYLDGQLSHRQRRRLEKELDQDEHLRDQLRQYAALDGLFGQLADQDVEGFDFGRQRAEIVAAAERKALLGRRSHRPVYFRPVFAGLAAAASLLLLAGVSVMLLNRPGIGPASAPVPAVSVRIVPAAMNGVGKTVVYMTMSPPAGQESPPEPEDAINAFAPPGTVAVSAGAHRRIEPTSPETMLIY